MRRKFVTLGLLLLLGVLFYSSVLANLDPGADEPVDPSGGTIPVPVPVTVTYFPMVLNGD